MFKTLTTFINCFNNCTNIGSGANIYRVIIKYCTIVVGVGGLVECAASFITWVRLVSPIGGATGGSGNLSISYEASGTS
jgi:hypothetical protein